MSALALLLAGFAAQHVHPAPAPPPAHGHRTAPEGHEGHEGHKPADAAPTRPLERDRAHDHHRGHDTPAAPDDPHAGHDAHAGHAPGVPTPPPAPPPPGASDGPDHAADALFGADRMAAARGTLAREHGGGTAHFVGLDRLELRSGGDGDHFLWDGSAWIGGDMERLLVKSEGEAAIGGAVEQAELQLLWARAIDPWFDLELGVRHDVRPSPSTTHLALGVSGDAPYWIELDAALFLSTRGDLTARIEAEHDVHLTQSLILQPRAELNLAARDVPEIRLGRGLTAIEAGLRLRYEIVPEVAPYVGVEYERLAGRTARLARADGERADGEDVGGWRLIVGLKGFF